MLINQHRVSRPDRTPLDRILVLALITTGLAIAIALLVLAVTGDNAFADEPAPTTVPEGTCIELAPDLWMTAGPIPLPCGPTLAAQPTYPPIDPETGCTEVVASTGCPGDQPPATEPAPAPAAVQAAAQPTGYCDDSSCTSTVPDTTTTTTTVAPSTSSTTSTTAAPTTTTTVVPSTTTRPPAPSTSTTTTSVAVGPPPTVPGPTTVPPGPTPLLPITGDDHRAEILTALVVGLAGVVLVVISRRRSES